MRWIFECSTLRGCLDPLIFNLSINIIKRPSLPSQPGDADDKPAIMQMLLWFFEVGNVRLHHYSWLWSRLTSCLRPVCPSQTPNGSVRFDPSNLPKLFSGYQVEVPNLISETVQSSLSNTRQQSARETRRGHRPSVKTARKNFLFLLPLISLIC